MEQTYFEHPESGARVIATNEVQCDAYKNAGFKEISRPQNEEFASESAFSQAELNNMQSQMDAQSQNVQQANATSSTANNFGAEFAQDEAMTAEMNKIEADAQAEMDATMNKTNKKSK
jgi:hypothetical protein